MLEASGNWRKLYIRPIMSTLHLVDLIFENDYVCGNEVRMCKGTNACILVWKFEGKNPLGRLRDR
jgi:hypothetical protein